MNVKNVFYGLMLLHATCLVSSSSQLPVHRPGSSGTSFRTPHRAPQFREEMPHDFFGDGFMLPVSLRDKRNADQEAEKRAQTSQH